MRSNNISNAFPPPEFLNIPFAGLSISDSAIRCIQFGRKNGRLYIEKHIEKDIPSGVIVSGQINNKDALVSLLLALKKDLKLNYVKISLPEERAYLFTAKIPIVKRNEVISAIESKIEENVPVPPGELTFDYILTEHIQKGHLDVVVSTLPISVIDIYVEIASNAGLSLLSLEIESQAIATALLSHDNLDTVLIVNFYPNKVGLYVASLGVVHFTSTISTKGESFKNPDFLLQEINKLYVYWHTLKENLDKPERKIRQIIICGENFEDTVVKYLSLNIQTPVVLGNVWTNTFDINSEVPEIPFSNSLRFAAAVGLALPSDILVQEFI